MRLKAAVRIAILDVCTATIRDSMDDNRDDDCCVRWGRGARAGSRASNGSIWQRFPSSSTASSSLVISTWEKKRKLKGSQKTRTLSRQTALMTDSLGAPPTDGRQKFFQIARASRAPRSPAGSWPISMLSQMMDICTRDATLCSFRLTCRFVFVSRQTPLISAFRWINTWAQMSLTSVIRAVITAFSLSRAKDVLLSPFQVSECTDQCFVSGSLNSNSN